MRHALAVLFLLLASCAAAAHPRAFQTPTPTPTPQQLTTLQKLWRALGLTATPRNQRGELIVQTGNIYVATLDENLTPVSRRKVATGAFASPVLLPGGTHLLALRGETIVKVSASPGPTPEDVGEVKGIARLVQVSEDDPDQLVVLLDADNDGCPTAALYSISTKALTPLALERTPETVDTRNYLIGSERAYENGDFRLLEEEQVSAAPPPPVRWKNIFLKPRDKPKIPISGCPRGVNCVQPSFLKTDPALVAYVRVE